MLRPEIGALAAALGSGRSYCPIGSDSSTESDENGLWIAEVTHTGHPYRECSLCHLVYLGARLVATGLPPATYLQEVVQVDVG